MNIKKASVFTSLYQCIMLMGSRRKVFLVFLAISLAAVVASGVIIPLMNKNIINAIEFGEWSLYKNSILLLIIATVIFWVISPLASYYAAWANRKAMYQIRNRLISHLLGLPYDFHDRQSKGDTLSLLSNDLDCLERIYDGELYSTLENFFIGFTGVVMLFVIDWRLAIFACILGGASTWITNRYGIPLGKIGDKLQVNAGKTTTVFLDILKGIRTIKLFNLKAIMNRRLSFYTSQEALHRTELAMKQAQMNTITGLMNGMSTFGIIIVGAFMVNSGLTNWGAVVVVASLQNLTGDLFSLFPASLANMRTSLAGVNRLFKVLDEKVETLALDRYRCEKNSDMALEMSNVSFGYSEHEPVVRDVSFSIKKGELTALVGESGAGKSTLFKLILGFYMPDKGEIKVHAKKAVPDIETWRDLIAYVPQESKLFKGTIAENISCGKDDLHEDQIMAAANAAGIHDFIHSLPKKYDTPVLEDGNNFSVGQRQRIIVARAIAKDAKIILLDEFTSALDGENEANIMETVRQLAKDRAILIITHRDTTLNYVDRIFRLTNKTIVSV